MFFFQISEQNRFFVFQWNYPNRAEIVGSGSYCAKHSEVILGKIVDGVEMIEWDARTLAVQWHLCLRLRVGIKKTLWFVLCFLKFPL